MKKGWPVSFTLSPRHLVSMRYTAKGLCIAMGWKYAAGYPALFMWRMGKARAAISRAGIHVFGFRVVEPHHDGTPHWHMLLFMRPQDVDTVRDILCYHARITDSEELQTPNALKARFHVEAIDPAKGSATGYIAKYISKNIDGFALDGEQDEETGENLRDMAKSVSAWASRWRIRQFQQIGGAPVTVWRELRRLRIRC